MDSRMELSALERSRLLNSLPSSALGHLGLVSEQSHSSALNRLSAASAAAAAAAGASPPDLARAGSPTTGLGQYPGRYMPSTLHSPGASYAMMAGYFGGSGHIPESFKALMPEFQQYWGTSQEAYARQLLTNMYYPYLPYLPATESLSLFAQNSATAAQVQAAAHAHAAHHRIYDLHKEALFGPGSMPSGFYPQSSFLPTQHTSQMEATNLSVSSANKSKIKEEKDKHKHIDTEHNKPNIDSAKHSGVKTRLHEDDRPPSIVGSERTRGMNLKKPGDDHMKYRSTDGNKKPSASSSATSSLSYSKADQERKRSKLETVLRQSKENNEESQTATLRECKSERRSLDTSRSEKLSSPVTYNDYFTPIPAFSPSRSTAFHSPNRTDRVISPDRRSSKAHSPIRLQKIASPIQHSDRSLPIQDKPENLCVKDRNTNLNDTPKTDKHKTSESNSETVVVKTQSIVTGTTVTVTSTLNVITTDHSPRRLTAKDSATSPKHLSSPSANATTTTYSLPYYHNLYSRSQTNSQEGKKVHAVTYVPEIGTIASPLAGTPSVTEVKSATKDETDLKAINQDLSMSGHLSESPKGNPEDNVLGCSSDNSSLKHTDIRKIYENHELSDGTTDKCRVNKSISPCHPARSETIALKKKVTKSPALADTSKQSDASGKECEKDVSECVQKLNAESLKRNKSVSPIHWSVKKVSTDERKEASNNCGQKESVSSNTEETLNVDEVQNETTKEPESKATSKSSAININNSVSSKTSTIHCDMNHNSKSAKSSNMDSLQSKCTLKPGQSESMKRLDHLRKDTPNSVDEKDLSKKSSKDSGEKHIRAGETIKPDRDSESKKTEKSDSSKVSCKNEKVLKRKDVDKGPTKEKKDHGLTTGGSTIPVGIAVARQRNIAPKTDKETAKSSDDIRGKLTTSAEIKPVRPLKIIRPSSKGKPHGAADFRNDLPANLIVTGGNNSGGLFWSNDQASRQLAAHYLQTNNQLNTSNWFGQGHLTFPPSNQTQTSEAGQLPLSVPPGYKLAQDSLTGDILLIPSATDVYDSSRVFPSFHLGAQNAPTYAHSVLASPQTQGTIPTAPATFLHQSSLSNESSHFQPSFSAEVLPRPDIAVKEEKREINTRPSTDSIITSTVSLASGQDNGPVSMIVHNEIDKDKLMTVPPPSFVTDLSLTSTQQCAYAFHPPTMPYIFNASVLPVHNINEPSTDINPSKIEHTSVQSRGTSPMLPATDSSNEETEECSSQPDEKADKTETDEKLNEPKPHMKTSFQLNEKEISSKSEPKNVQTECEIAQEVSHKGDSELVKEMPIVSNSNIQDSVVIEVAGKDDTNIDTKAELSNLHKHNESELHESSSKSNQHEVVTGEGVTNVSTINPAKETKTKCCRTKNDRNIFDDITEYNPFTDPQILQAADGLELLSALAEKSSLCSNINQTDTNNFEEPKTDIVKEDIYTFKEDKISTSESLGKRRDDVNASRKRLPKEAQTPKKSRIKCGYAFKPSKTPDATPTTPVKMTTFCGITIPEDDDVIDSIEMEMKMRLVELQKRYKEKQKELSKLKTKKEKEKEKEKEKSKEEEKEKDNTIEIEKTFDPKRGRGRPKKRKPEEEENSSLNSDSQSPKVKVKKEASTPIKSSPNGQHSKAHVKPHVNAAHNAQNSGSHGSNSNGAHGASKKKKLAEMLVDRVFRKTGSSFKIPLSKKISLIAPSRIEFSRITCTSTTEKAETRPAKKSLDFRRLIKGSRLSQLNGKDRSFDGGLWRRKEEKRRHSLSNKSDEKRKHSLSTKSEEKHKKPKKQVEQNGLGLLAEYATKYQEEKERETEKEKEKAKEREKEKEKLEKTKKKRKTEELSLSPDSPNKKRKPGRPKKCDLIKPGVTETIVAKQSKHMDFFRWQKDECKQERKISLEGKTPLKPLYLDEWNVRRSERIFLSDSSPQTSPNTLSPGIKPKVSDMKSKSTEDEEQGKISPKAKTDPVKKQRSTNLQDISQKLKKKYSTTFSQKSKEKSSKTSELLKARDQLTKNRHKKKTKKKSKTEGGSDSDTSTDDLPLSSIKSGIGTQDLPTCIIDKDELEDGLRILIFMDGLFHEGEIKAIRPPDVYGAILDNERRTRPHICSQEEILRDAIKDVKPMTMKQMKEGTRVCAYWSQQFSCLYPGTVSKGTPDPHEDKSLVFVEFDDGDNGKIPLDHIRMIPEDFPIVEYDPHPLLLLTKRRRTLSTSESSEPRISCSNIPPSPKENKGKRGPGRPPKADRLISEESVGDEDVFTNGSVTEGDTQEQGKDKSEKSTPKKTNNEQTVQSNIPRQLWKWSGSSTKRPGLKGKARKEYYKCIVRGRETIMVGECAVFLSTGRPNLPYVGRIESLWESWGGQMVVKVKWFYHPEETKGGKRLQNMKGALFRSDHEDENDVQTISHKCEVLKYEEFRRRKSSHSFDELSNMYYLAGSYQPTIGHIKFEPGVI